MSEQDSNDNGKKSNDNGKKSKRKFLLNVGGAVGLTGAAGGTAVLSSL